MSPKLSSSEKGAHPSPLVSVDEQSDTETSLGAINHDQDATIGKTGLRSLWRTPDVANWIDPGAPDGGIVAWTQVLVGHLIIMNTW